MLGVPTEPVYAGQIQAPGLGVDLAAFDPRRPPGHRSSRASWCAARRCPSMPLGFWNDPDGDALPRGVFLACSPACGGTAISSRSPRERGIIVYGRSDATLNPGGVRIGTAEIYRPLDTIPEIVDALAVGKRVDEDEVIWLFVVLQDGLDARRRRSSSASPHHPPAESPRHVPRRIFQVSQLPRTRSGKTMEMAVSRLVNGQPVPNREVVANPEALDEIARVATM